MSRAHLIRHRLGTTVLLCALAAPAGVLGLAGAAPAAATVSAHAHVAVLTAITATHHKDHDRLLFTFAGTLPAHRSARYVRRIPDLATGLGIAGRATLLVTFARATGTPGRAPGAYGPASQTFPLPGVIQVTTVRVRPAKISFGVGLARQEPVRIIALGHHRVAIDVPTPYKTVGVQDFFVNSHSPPGVAATQAVARPVIKKSHVSGALERLFAGPTAAEQGRGLRFVASGATGYRGLTIRRGVARVYLEGRCVSGGSPITIATEMVPTLKQFPSVRWVKIYDPAGHTQQPGGRSDSIPVCLKPSEVKVLTARLRGPVLAALVVLAGPGILIGLVLSILSVVAGVATRPRLITPRAYQAERTKAKPVPTGQFPPDLAWPFYPVRQMRSDLSRIEAERRARYGKLWKWPFRPLVWFLFFPISAVVVVCLLIAGLATLVLTGLFALVTFICAGIVMAAFTTGVLLLRGVEGGYHKMVHAEASCPHCYHVTARPAYLCPGCGDLHRDLRPGRLGLFTRRCQCGTLLPTTALRAAWRLTAVCQRCKEPMRAGSGSLRDVRIPIFGDTSAGKTRFLYAGLSSLVETTRRAGIPLGFPDEESEQQATLALEVIRSGQDTAKTPEKLPTALTCQVGKGASRTLIHMFDVAGESYQDAETHDSLGFLDRSHCLVYVLDPFSIGSVRDHLAGHSATVIEDAHAAVGDPETAYTEVVSRLRDSGVEAARQRLAVVVSKADLLAGGHLDLPGDSEAIADWLKERRLHNLVLSVRREFAEARFFAVASVAPGRGGGPERCGSAVAGLFAVASVAPGRARGQYDAGAPLRWLLASRGLRLPASPGTGRPGPAPRTNPEDASPEDASRGRPTRDETARTPR